MLRSQASSIARSFSTSAARSHFAKMQLLGNVGSINTRETKDGVPFLTYSLAVNRYNPQAENGQADWYNLSVFDEKSVNFFQNHLRAGASLFVEADVRQREIVDSNGEGKIVTSLRQTSFHVVRFPKKITEEEGESA
ncbi:hypothetical protein FT663_03297 [Candidozyma haemuli var. vulneris]|uniref:Single-stranded DNA-binding protein RIM1, mitochondrial n=1 Tax=Candidozyma haemuli TaxID=45357 RepID=A0A2V1ATZ5_9ASCO|nr:hypothetical protein CXQ85_000281 [[Candida] haemuloni]KAF3988445.1 hypothetical protein FT662_03394 [[Candida] haemuloni var. vulneris]KAF3990148.1 hypothetical protein FT663_03297 [[Candida] haemuloni var. vulneris]PVH21308.1 hypothetical protein CXQ85_000281 [[Candida] haemuloni]